jgi:hypothetical protein
MVVVLELITQRQFNFSKNIRQSPVNICPFFLYRCAVTTTAHQEEQDETKNDSGLLTI